jgi:uncharacterized protein YodC (DUF2158 family)
MIKVGDIVIKKTGGNKMRVTSVFGQVAECVWFTEKFNQDNFLISDLILMKNYPTLFLDEKRDEKIQKILNSL